MLADSFRVTSDARARIQLQLSLAGLSRRFPLGDQIRRVVKAYSGSSGGANLPDGEDRPNLSSSRWKIEKGASAPLRSTGDVKGDLKSGSWEEILRGSDIAAMKFPTFGTRNRTRAL